MASESIAISILVSTPTAQEASKSTNTDNDDFKETSVAITVPSRPAPEVSKATNTDAHDLEGFFVFLHRKPPLKAIVFVLFLLLLGIRSIAFGLYMVFKKVGNGVTHGILFSLLGMMMFIPGFYYSRIAWYAYKGYKGFSFSGISIV